MPKISPRPTENVTSSTAVTSPYRLWSPSTVITVSMAPTVENPRAPVVCKKEDVRVPPLVYAVLLPRPHQPRLVRPHRRLDAAAQPQLRQHPRHVRLRGE